MTMDFLFLFIGLRSVVGLTEFSRAPHGKECFFPTGLNDNLFSPD
jgi:hypothetical protein